MPQLCIDAMLLSTDSSQAVCGSRVFLVFRACAARSRRKNADLAFCRLPYSPSSSNATTSQSSSVSRISVAVTSLDAITVEIGHDSPGRIG